MSNSISISDFLTEEQISEARSIYKMYKPSPARQICKQIIEPNIEEINKKLRTKMDPMYLAYFVEHIFNLTV